jgi:hypothetical protein
MDERTSRISELLAEAGELHHSYYRLTDGADDDWASFYAEWLVSNSELPETLGSAPTRSHLVHELVESERALADAAPDARWQDVYAERIVARFG